MIRHLRKKNKLAEKPKKGEKSARKRALFMLLHSLISAANDEHQTRASRSARGGVETGLQRVELGKDIFNCLLCVGVLGRTAAKEQIGTSLQQ